jgi:serine/threonine protein kinase
MLPQERGRLDYSALPQVVAQILCGLEFVHSQNVCHRDVKPQNILVLAGSSSLVIKIGDFGKDRSDS